MVPGFWSGIPGPGNRWHYVPQTARIPRRVDRCFLFADIPSARMWFSLEHQHDYRYSGWHLYFYGDGDVWLRYAQPDRAIDRAVSSEVSLRDESAADFARA